MRGVLESRDQFTGTRCITITTIATFSPGELTGTTIVTLDRLKLYNDLVLRHRRLIQIKTAFRIK